ncbi:MAG: redoxin domain-containing protein, partial [Phycisphaerales bacterium]
KIGRVVESGQYDPAYFDPQPGETCEVRFGDEGLIAVEKKMPSLLGKTLPDLRGISVVFSPEQHKDKMILVCFWDMNQRPSRNCIAQLAVRAEQLSQKGVTIVAIQASKVDEKALDKWVRANDIPFPVGAVQSNEEETRSAWGVRSLPWLILTDRNHVVRKEGFGLSELDQENLTGGGETSKPAESKHAPGKSRILHFPGDRSMGMLFILDANKVDISSYEEWTPLCEATGDVTAPAGKALRLDLSKDAGSDLSPLSALRSNDLAMLFCYGVEIDDEQLKHISHLTGLQELYMRDAGILGTGLKYLAKLKSLKRLRVDNTHVGDNELAHLSDLPGLESLNLWLTPTTDAGMVHVGRITSLRSLVLGRGVSDEGLARLKGLTSLRYLLTGSQAITDEGLRHLADMAEMESLDLRDTQITDAGLAHLKQMKKLKNLILYSTRVTEKGLLHVSAFGNLQNLSLSFDVADAGLMHLSKLTLLKRVGIDGDLITSKGLAALSEMKSLEEVSVSRGDNTDEIVSKLAGLSSLKGLHLGRGLTDEGLVQLANMTTLQELGLNGAQITNKGIAALVALPSLRRLSFLDMELSSEEFWMNLGKLTSLRRLDLSHIRSKVTDGHIAHLASLQSLTQLSINAIVIKDRKAISSLDITDKGLGYMSRLKSLEHLSLSGAEITDEGLLQLSEIPTLRWMDLQGCGVTEQGLQELKKKLPALRWYL